MNTYTNNVIAAYLRDIRYTLAADIPKAKKVLNILFYTKVVLAVLRKGEIK